MIKNIITLRNSSIFLVLATIISLSQISLAHANEDTSGLFGSNPSTDNSQDGPTTPAIVVATTTASSSPSTDANQDGAGVFSSSPSTSQNQDGSGLFSSNPSTDANQDGSTTTSTTTKAPTDTTGGNTGGAGATVSSGGGSSGFSSLVSNALSSSTTPVAPNASTTLSCPLLTNFVIPGQTNSPTDISKLQLFLNLYNGAHLTVNGVLDQSTIDAVKAFQTAHLSDVMGPWGATVASGQVYITTLKEINSIACNSSKTFTPDELATIAAFKAAQVGQTAPVAGTPSSATSTNPVVGTTASTSATSTNPGIINNNASLVGNALGSVGGIFKSFGSWIKSWF